MVLNIGVRINFVAVTQNLVQFGLHSLLQQLYIDNVGNEGEKTREH